ncbi:MAG: hypothetical protein IK144_03075 [Bacteroidaceae bacterium]|nr:hypothetical protein [Bacteroidaceae bacterium]
MKKTYICPQMMVYHTECIQMLAASDTGLRISYDEADDSESLVKGNGFYESDGFDFEW